jgi:allantoinase
VAARHQLPVAVHCEMESQGDEQSEIAAVRWAAAIIASERARLHVVHVSAAGAIDEARKWPGTTTETCPQYLFLQDDVRPEARCSPPIRDGANRQALWERVIKGAVDWIASDHSPCPPAQRYGPAQWAGIDGVGLTLPLLLSDERLDPQSTARLTTAAARHLRLTNKGSVKIGYDADLVLVDPSARSSIQPETLWTKHKASPFEGQQLRAKVEMTLIRGRVLFSAQEGPGPMGGGRFIRPR